MTEIHFPGNCLIYKTGGHNNQVQSAAAVYFLDHKTLFSRTQKPSNKRLCVA